MKKYVVAIVIAVSALFGVSVQATPLASETAALQNQVAQDRGVTQVYWRRWGWRGYGWRGYGWRGYGWRRPYWRTYGVYGYGWRRPVYGWGWRGYGWRRPYWRVGGWRGYGWHRGWRRW